MNTPNSVRPNAATKTPPSEDDSRPISISMVVSLSDARKSSRIFELGRQQSFAVSPESLAALPGHFNSLVRGVGGDAQIELSKFLKLLAQPEPPVEEPPPTSANPAPSTCSQPELLLALTEPGQAPAQNPERLADEYHLSLDVSLLGTLPS